MFRRTDPAVASNLLTSRWAARLGDGSTVVSGAGVWPLLALLAAGADGQGLVELEDAIGIPASKALPAAAELLDLMDRSEAVRAALGVWFRSGVEPLPEWAAKVPAGAIGSLGGDLDAWVAERTDGRITRLPVTVHPQTPMLLASALLVRTEWRHRFSEAPVAWGGREVPGLRRRTHGTDVVTVYDTPAGVLTTVLVEGLDEVVVHLVLGEPGRPAAAVLPAAIDAVTEQGEDGRRGAADGPGLRRAEEVTGYGPQVRLALPRFEVAGDHDLTALGEVFGLRTVLDASRGHFPGVSSYPLAVGQARQDAVATFTADGFEAAAVTAMALMAGSIPPDPKKALVIDATFDRPFGFVAVHRPSRLVLVAGWVAEPARS